MIVVFGSINVDFVTAVARLPREGETVAGDRFTLVPGGKGANQALAAARAGARVRMAGAVGRDHLADAALALLKVDAVDLSRVEAVDAPTGAAFIAVDANGRNQIVVAAGANAAATAAGLVSTSLQPGDTLLLQYEVTASESKEAARLAKAAGARVILNAAPAMVPEADLWPLLDVLIVNEYEAIAIAAGLGWSERDPRAIATGLNRAKGCMIVVTLGSAGAMAVHQGRAVTMAAPSVAVVDTTAAGDAFVGAFAAALDRVLPLETALRHGIAAGSLACQVAGAQPSLPAAAAIAQLANTLQLTTSTEATRSL